MTAVRPLAASVVALSIAGAFTPIPASAAPVPCERAENYAAQSGAELLRLNRLDLRPVGRDDQPVTRVGLADAKSALIANGKVNSAAVSRMLDAEGAGSLTSPVIQQTPPTHSKASTRGIRAADAGPFAFGNGALSSHARWAPGLACAAEDGEVTRAAVTLAAASIFGDENRALFTVRKKVSSLSTTALDGRGPAARAVASATVGAGMISLLGGAVQIKIRRAPTLTASMATNGGEVRYVPPVLEVSGRGIHTAHLDVAGDQVEFTVDGNGVADHGGGSLGTRLRHDSASGHQGNGDPTSHLPGGSYQSGDDPASEQSPDVTEAAGSASGPQTLPSPKGSPGSLDERAASTESALAGLLGGLLAKAPVGGLTSASPLPLPTVPGVPPVGGEPESAQVAGPGTTLRISLGDVRQARSGHAIAARVSTIKIALTGNSPAGQTGTGYGNGAPDRGGVILDLDVGALEAAAVAPEPGGAQGAVAGAGGGLPITGPRVDYLAIAGLALLVLGATATLVGRRRQRTRR